jgi:hypothetical protein
MGIGCGLVAVALAMLCGVGMFFAWRAQEDAKKELEEANRLWDAGKKAEAVIKYRTVLDMNLGTVPSDAERPVVYQRAIDFELEQGHTDTARALVEKALDKKVDVSRCSPAAAQFIAQVRADREKREAEERARREAEEKRKREEREAEAKRREEERAKTGGTTGGTGAPNKGTPNSGEQGYIEVDDVDTVWVSIDEQAAKELNRFSAAKNAAAIMQMIQQGRVLVCEKRTRVSVVDAGIFSTTVRIMEGPHSGKTGIVPNEFLHK